MYALGNPVCLGMFPGQNGAREKPHGLPVRVTAFSPPIHSHRRPANCWDFSAGISGDPRSTLDTWLSCVGNSTDTFCTDRCSEWEQCATCRDFCDHVVSERRIISTCHSEHLCCSYGEPQCFAMRITQRNKWLLSCLTNKMLIWFEQEYTVTSFISRDNFLLERKKWPNNDERTESWHRKGITHSAFILNDLQPLEQPRPLSHKLLPLMAENEP